LTTGTYDTSEMTVSPPRTLDPIAPGVSAPAGERTAPDGLTIPLADALSGLYPVGRKELENIGVWVVDTEEYLSAAACPAA